MGYENGLIMIHNQESKDIDLGEIQLVPKTIKLDSVKVVARSFLHKADKIMAFPTEKQVNSSTSCLHLLQHLLLPNLVVDPVQETMSIQGTSGIIFKINGINASLDEVKALKPEQIRCVDYRQVPYIRELDSNSGTINFILKAPRVGTSLSGNLLSAVSTGMLNGGLNLRTNYKKSQLSLDYNVNYRGYSKRKTNELETYLFPNGKMEAWDKRGEFAPFGYTQHNISVGYLYNGKKDVVSIRFNNLIYNQNDNNLMNIFQNQNILLKRKIHSAFSNYAPSFDFTYSHKLGQNEGYEINMLGTVSNNNYERNLLDIYEDNRQYETRNISDGHQKSIIGEVYYWKEGDKLNFSAGLKSTHLYAHNFYQQGTDVSLRNFNAYPYLQMGGKISNVFYTIGTGFKYQRQNQEGKSSNYLRNISSLSLAYMEKFWNVKYTMTYNSYFPSLSSLSDIVQPIDTFSVTKGNENLKPYSSLEHQIAYTLSDNKSFITILTLAADKSFRPIQQDVLFSSSYNKFIYQEHNQKSDVNYSAQLVMQISDVFNFFTIQVRGGWNYYKSKGELYSHSYNDLNYGIFLGGMYRNLSVSAAFGKPQKTLSGQYLTTSENFSNIGASYKLKNIAIELGVQFPFTAGSEYRTERLTENAKSDRKVLIRDNRNMFYLKVSFNLNWGRPIFQLNKRLQNSDNSNSIIKINDN